MNKLNPYLKAVVTVLTTVLSGLAVYYGHTHWYPIVVMGVGAISVYFTPNIPSAPKS